MSSMFLGVAPVDMATFTVSVLVFAALSGSYLSARRVAALYAIETLRLE